MKLASRLKKTVLDTLFPVSCLSCDKEEVWICRNCLEKIALNKQQFCAYCENMTTLGGILCHSCREQGKSHIDGLIAAASFENPLVKKAVFNLKYRFVANLADPLSQILLKVILKNDVPLPKYIVPVPLHRRRLRWRGFNQSRLLAECLSAGLAPPMNVEILDALERTKHKKPQMEIKKYRDRLANAAGIFSLKVDPAKIKNARILLVDDIATTGATLQECAKVLKAAGASRVFAAVIARQTLKK
jgi:ComF family protein